jgi:hypothetical protein
MKDETPKPRYGDKAPKHKKVGTSLHHIGFHMLIINYKNKIFCKKYLATIVCYYINAQHN